MVRLLLAIAALVALANGQQRKPVAIDSRIQVGFGDTIFDRFHRQDLVWTQGVRKYNAKSSSQYQSVPDTILKAETQPASGTLYHLEVLMKETNCLKASVGRDGLIVTFLQTDINELIERRDQCQVRPDGLKDLCIFEIWHQYATNTTEVTKDECQHFAG